MQLADQSLPSIYQRTMDATPEELDALFGWPSTLPSTVVPGPLRQAGWSHESTHEVLALLKDNHQRWHIFFNQQHFHKYVRIL